MNKFRVLNEFYILIIPSLSMRKYKERGHICKNQILLFHLSLLWNTTTGSWPPALFIQGLYRNISIKYTVSDYTNRQNFLSLPKSWVWAMPALLSDNSFQYTHIHVACWEFFVTRRGCSPCIMSWQLLWVFFFHAQSSFSFPYLVLLCSTLTHGWVLPWSVNLHFRSFSRLNITVMLAGSRLTSVTRLNLLNPESIAERIGWNSAHSGF